MTTVNLEVGKTYLINHSRKGVFAAEVSKIREDWLDCVVIEGFTNTTLLENVCYMGDSVSLKRQFIISATEVLSAQQSTKNCANCEYKAMHSPEDKGHCYMFRNEPDVCAKFIEEEQL